MALTSRLLKTDRYITFFQKRILHMVQHWRDLDAVNNVEIGYLDREHEAILQAVSLGLDFLPAWPFVTTLIVRLTPYMERRGHWDYWETVLKRAVKIAQEQKDGEAETTLTAHLARLCQRMGRPSDVVFYYRRTIALARYIGNQYEEARACCNLGYLYVDYGRWWRSDVLSRHALKLFEQLGSDHGCAHTHNHLGVLRIRQKEWENAEEHLREACRLWQTMHDTHSLIYGYLNLGLLQLDQGFATEAIDLLQQAEALAEQVGERALLGGILNNLAVAHRIKGNYPEALQLAQQAEQLHHRYALVLELAQDQHNIGLIYEGMGEFNRAVTLLQTSKRVYQQLNHTTGVTMIEADCERVQRHLQNANTVLNVCP